ncbi:hypothetical protein DL93DRAFT_2051790 [Clavulina sp. PMI_390]|nr:hypothetical protein DL93DRAFT_2051790 [Clavulina sp. PMI_390]
MDENTTDAQIIAASAGFEAIFNDDLKLATSTFSGGSSPFHSLGNGVAHFLQAALGMEACLLSFFTPTKYLTIAEAGAKEQAKLAKSGKSPFKDVGARQFRQGIEWDALQADAIVLLGLTNALQESYMGFAKCFAHSKFTTLFKEVYPNGLDSYATPGASRKLLRQASSPTSASAPSPKRSLFGWGGSSSGSSTPITPPTGKIEPQTRTDELILSGVAFGFGLFNLILSLLPPKIRCVIPVFLLGFKSDRALGLKALAVSANGYDSHSEFAALALMTYNGVVLLVSGWQADGARLMRQYDSMLNKVEARYPHGSLWLLNRAKLQRYSGNNPAAIETLLRGLSPERPIHFQQADAMLVFELGWIYLAERKYEESAEMFLKMQTLNNWSHSTYSFLAAGCYFALNTEDGTKKAKEQLDRLPGLLERRKIGGRDLPTEVFIKKKMEFYKKKQAMLGGNPADYADAIKMPIAEELGVVWNTHGNIKKELAEAHIVDILVLTPPPTIPTPYLTASSADAPAQDGKVDLILPDELTSRDLLLGILHRGAEHPTEARAYLESATTRPGVEGQWMINTAHLELAVLTLKTASAEDNASATDKESSGTTTVDPVAAQTKWKAVLAQAEKHLTAAATGTGPIDLSSRLETRIAFLRDEIAAKKNMLGL